MVQALTLIIVDTFQFLSLKQHFKGILAHFLPDFNIAE